MTSFPLRRGPAVPRRLSSLAALLGTHPPAGDPEIGGVAPVGSAGPDELGFLADRRYLRGLPGSRAGALLVAASLEEALGSDPRPRLVVPNPHRALVVLLEALHPHEAPEPEIHATAVIGRGARLGTGVRVGPYAVIEEGAVLGDRVSVGAHCVVGVGVRVGDDSVLHPHCVLYPGTVLGARVILHAGVRAGVDGFGYAFEGGAHRKVPQVGGCVIGDDVEVGANTTIDRGSIGDTVVGSGAKLDNLVHLGHNVKVGELSVLAGQAGVAGSTEIGKGVQVGGQAGIGGHLTVGDGARVAAQAGVTGDIPPGETVMGFPARPRAEFLRGVAALRRIPDLLRGLRERRPGRRGRAGKDPDGEASD